MGEAATLPAENASRFAGLAAWPARIVLLLLLALTLYGMATPPAAVPVRSGNAQEDVADVLLYDRIVADVRAGRDYHEAAADAQRAGDYPLRPFVTMRLPTLAWVQAALPGRAASTILLHLLIVGAAAAWAWRLRSLGARPTQVAIGALLVLAGSTTLRLPELLSWHEGWAALLVALSLAVRGERRFGLAIALGLAAVLIREHAVVYPAMMAAAALLSRRSREAACWSAAIALFALFLLWHAGQVLAVTLPTDGASPGWASGGGWSFVVTMIQLTGPLRLFPQPLAALLVPLAMLGWAGWRTAIGARAALMLAAYLLAFALFGRIDNFYWGFLVAPLILLGLLFAPRALRDLGTNAFARPAAAPVPQPR
jgi:hypothetical protein